MQMFFEIHFIKTSLTPNLQACLQRKVKESVRLAKRSHRYNEHIFLSAGQTTHYWTL